MATLTKGNLFPSVVVTDVFNKVKGRSTLARLCTARPVSFNGSDIFTFNMDTEISIVAEGANKPHGGFTVAPIKVAPVKVVYQGRVTDEFMYASEEAKVDILGGFNEGFARKLAKGLDMMAFHGVNPATGAASNLIGSYFDDDVTNTVTYDADDGGDAAVAAAIQMLGDNNATGIAMSGEFANILAGETHANGVKKFPELEWGGRPETLRGLACDVNNTVGSADYAIVGDFDAFRWGFAKDVALEVIEYGDPDGSGVDLKAANQVMLRAEAYIGFAVIDPSAFARVLPTPATPSNPG